MAGLSSRKSRNRDSGIFYLRVLMLLLLFIIFYGIVSVLQHATFLERKCVSVESHELTGRRQRIAIVSFSSESRPGGNNRNFDGLKEIVWPNKRMYADMEGYDFIDASDVVDWSRPPSWSKILAIKRHLRFYDWIFWNDADSLVMNFGISLDQVLEDVIGEIDHVESLPDLVLTKDINGINAGLFFVRNSDWSIGFLDAWWNQTEFIRAFGSTKSGDNDALKHLVSCLSPVEFKEHVRIARMQCLYNSYPWFPSFKSIVRFIAAPRMTIQGVYLEGDFMVHLAGLDDKKSWARKALEGNI